VQSLGTVGDAFDNAVIESFWGSMQIELLNRRKSDTRIELAAAMVDWIEASTIDGGATRRLATSRPTNSNANNSQPPDPHKPGPQNRDHAKRTNLRGSPHSHWGSHSAMGVLQSRRRVTDPSSPAGPPTQAPAHDSATGIGSNRSSISSHHTQAQELPAILHG